MQQLTSVLSIIMCVPFLQKLFMFSSIHVLCCGNNNALWWLRGLCDNNGICMEGYGIYTLKTPGSTWPGKRVHWGHTLFRVKRLDAEFGQLSADLTNNGVRLTQLRVTFRVKLTAFRVTVDPEWSLTPMDLFRVKFDRTVFTVYRLLEGCCVRPVTATCIP